MSIHYIDLIDLPRYPNAYLSKRLLKIVEKDGLIVPLIYDDRISEIHECDQDRFMAFRRIAESSGDKGATNVLVCDYTGYS